MRGSVAESQSKANGFWNCQPITGTFSHTAHLFEPAAERNTKHQTPSSREVPNPKPQTPTRFRGKWQAGRFELGAWCFFGGWSLEFGVCCLDSWLLKNRDAPFSTPDGPARLL